MPLSEERRRQLDDIVSQMINNKEADNDIQFVVDDFKAKYENEQETNLANLSPDELAYKGAMSGVEPDTTGMLDTREAKARYLKDMGGVEQEKLQELFHTQPGEAGEEQLQQERFLPEFARKTLSTIGDINVGAGKGIASGVKSIMSPFEAVTESAVSLLPGGREPVSPAGAFRELTGEENPEIQAFKPEGRTQEVSKGVAEFGTKAGVGMAMTGGISGTGFLPSMAKGAMANIPFLPEAYEKGGGEGVAIDMAINTALDAALFGTGKLIGKGLEKIGTETLLGEMKIEKPLAKRIAQSFDTAKTKVANTIKKYKLGKIIGNFDGMAKRADELAESKYKLADELVDKFVKENPDKKVNVAELYGGLKDYLTGVDSPLASDEIEQGIKILDNILEGQKKRGLIPTDDMVNIKELVEIKRDLKKGKDIFKRGPGIVTADPAKVDVYKTAFHKVVDAISEYVPEAKALNGEAKDLFFVSDAADAAASRIRNHNKVFGFSDVVIGGGGAVAAMSNPERAAEIIALSALTLGGRRALSQGRGAAAAIKSGRALQSEAFKKAVIPTVSGISSEISPNIKIGEEEETEEEKRKKAQKSRARGY